MFKATLNTTSPPHKCPTRIVAGTHQCGNIQFLPPFNGKLLKNQGAVGAKFTDPLKQTQTTQSHSSTSPVQQDPNEASNLKLGLRKRGLLYNRQKGGPVHLESNKYAHKLHFIRACFDLTFLNRCRQES